MASTVLTGVSATLQLFRISADAVSASSEKHIKDRLESRKSNMNLRISTRRDISKDANSSVGPQETPSTSASNDYSRESTVMPSYLLFFFKIQLWYSLAISTYAFTLLILTSDATHLDTNISLGCCAVSTFFSSIMHLRDPSRLKYSEVQRVLNVGSSGCLLIALCLFPMNDSNDDDWSYYVYSMLGAVALLNVLILVEIWVTPLPPKSKEKKLVLSRKALLIMLRPYFWPDATTTSATVNRIRAILTWVSVIASKVCSLVSPIFLGNSLTALTRGDYDECIRNACIYATIQFLNTFFKENQSLMYMKVAQTAFVQLAEVSFDHLHKLSLDWHLRKKLGQGSCMMIQNSVKYKRICIQYSFVTGCFRFFLVTRSMDRGIGACDTLMKVLFMTLVPVVGECIAVCIIFAFYFNYFPLSVTVFFFIFIYAVTTFFITAWRRQFRIKMVEYDNDWSSLCTDSLVNFGAFIM